MEEPQEQNVGKGLTYHLKDEFNLDVYQRLGKQGGTPLNRKDERVLSARERTYRAYHPSPDYLPELGLDELFKPDPGSFFDLLYGLYEFISTLGTDLTHIKGRLKDVEKAFFKGTESRFSPRDEYESGRLDRLKKDSETKYRYLLYALAMLIRHRHESDLGITDQRMKANSVFIEQELENRLKEKDSHTIELVMDEVRHVARKRRF